MLVDVLVLLMEVEYCSYYLVVDGLRFIICKIIN